MELKEQNHYSVLQGDGFCISRILSRESSVGQSSRTFYRPAQGVPFKWETQPGTPKNPQEEDAIPPVCPSPLMQSLGLPLPNLDLDDPKESALKTSKIWSLRKIMKKNIKCDVRKKVEMLVRRSKQQERSSFGHHSNGGQFVAYKDSSCSSTSSSFSSSSSSSLSSSNSRDLDASRTDGPFCCGPWNIPAALVRVAKRD